MTIIDIYVNGEFDDSCYDLSKAADYVIEYIFGLSGASADYDKLFWQLYDNHEAEYKNISVKFEIED